MDTYAKIRKLRKKLRQIEHLEAIDRDLTDEEVSKCMKKQDTRDELLELLVSYNSQQPSDTDFDTSIATTADLSISTPVQQDEVINSEDIIPVIEESRPRDKPVHTEQLIDSNKNNSNSAESRNEQTKSSPMAVPVKQNPSSSNYPKTSTPSPTKNLKKPKPKPGGRSGSSVHDRWCNLSYSVSLLDSHNDLITAVDCCDGILVSASRDTTVKLWDLETLTELRSLGSHTGTVTDVVILSSKQVTGVGAGDLICDGDHLVLSGSTDCSLKVWSAKTGELARSIYTYNPITKIAFYPEASLVATASDGGKLELWNIDTKDCVSSEKAHSDSITGLCVSNGRLYTSCAVEGEIKVFELRDNKLHCIFASESVHNSTGNVVTLRHVRSLGVKGERIFYGDDGVNLKVLSWKQGVLKKCANHREEFGMTDAICCHGDLMMTSAYDLDNGLGYMNVFDTSTNEPVYLATIDDEQTRRILDICCYSNNNGAVTIATAGLDLQVWKQVPKDSNKEGSISSAYIQQLAQFAQDSDLESDVEFSESDEEAVGREGSRRGSVNAQQGGWMSWCTLT